MLFPTERINCIRMNSCRLRPLFALSGPDVELSSWEHHLRGEGQILLYVQ
jgi:hypothetical protein